MSTTPVRPGWLTSRARTSRYAAPPPPAPCAPPPRSSACYAVTRSPKATPWPWPGLRASWAPSERPIALHGVTVELTPTESTVDSLATVKTADRTGVEMEALTAVAAAGLALIDMVKGVDPAASLDGVRVMRKEGGKTGEWQDRKSTRL